MFTLNNPEAPLPVHDAEKYVVWQKEKGENGTEHFQGYVEFSKALTLGQMKAWLPRAHFEPRRGSREQARDYAMKEDTRVDGPWERGEFKQSRGQRSDITEALDFIKGGGSKREVFEQFPEIAAKFPRFVDQALQFAREDKTAKIMILEPRYPWQEKMLEMVEQEPDPRGILWVYDEEGNKGKTYMSKHLVDKYGAFYSNGGKGVDICYAYQGERIAVFDYVRDSKEFVNYGVIEQLKNGILFSHKYESGMKRFNVPHVVIMANFMPEREKFSADRLVVIKIKSDGDYDVI